MRLYSCGSNSDGQLSHGPDNTSDSCRFLPTSPSLSGTPLSLAFGARHTLLLLAPPSTSYHTPLNQLWVCGSNCEGQLGLRPSSGDSAGNEPATELRPLRLENLGVLELAAGPWEPVAVAACAETSFVVCRCKGPENLRDDVLVAMGVDDWGERGGAGQAGSGPQRISFDAFAVTHRANSAETRLRIVQIAAGPRHVVVVLERVDRATGQPSGWRRLVGWGAARQGQLGEGLADARGKALVKVAGPVELKLHREVVLRDGWDVANVALGMEHSAILLVPITPPPPEPGLAPTAAKLVLVGSSRKAQLGPNAASSHNQFSLPLAPRSTAAPSLPVNHQVGACWSSTLVLSPAGASSSLSAFGSNHHSQLALPPTTLLSAAAPQPIELPPPPPNCRRELRQLAAGSEHVLLHSTLVEEHKTTGVEEDEVWAWGWNEHGNLGTGGLKDVPTPTKVWPVVGQAGGKVTGVWAGNATSWIALV